MIFGRLFLLFLIIPLIEIGLFMTLGGKIGFPATLAIVVITAVIGAALTKSQGVSTVAKLQAKLAAGKIPGAEIVSALLILVAGAVLLTPGFLTDFIGFSLLIPPVRGAIGKWLAKRYASRVNLQVGGVPVGGVDLVDEPTERPVKGQVIDVEATVEE